LSAFRVGDEAITLQTNAFHAMSKPKHSKAGIHPATFKLADLWGSQGLLNHRCDSSSVAGREIFVSDNSGRVTANAEVVSKNAVLSG
jgi:hypothetical protein